MQHLKNSLLLGHTLDLGTLKPQLLWPSFTLPIGPTSHPRLAPLSHVSPCCYSCTPAHLHACTVTWSDNVMQTLEPHVHTLRCRLQLPRSAPTATTVTGICQCHDLPEIQLMRRTEGGDNCNVHIRTISCPAQMERQHTCDGYGQKEMSIRLKYVRSYYCITTGRFSVPHENLRAHVSTLDLY